jgi:hypothetical protein
MANQYQVVRLPDYVMAYAIREARDEGRRPSDVISQLWRLGLEAREGRKTEDVRNREIIATLRAAV